MTNAFEAGERKVIPAVLIYLGCGGDTLMIHKSTGRWNGLGGKLERDESPAEAARRELREECGVDLQESRFSPLGVLQFPNFKAQKNEDWLVFVLMATASAAERSQAWTTGPEGDLHWIPTRDVAKLDLWPGDRHFIPFVLDRKPFVGTIWYRGEAVTRHSVQALALES